MTSKYHKIHDEVINNFKNYKVQRDVQLLFWKAYTVLYDYTSRISLQQNHYWNIFLYKEISSCFQTSIKLGHFCCLIKFNIYVDQKECRLKITFPATLTQCFEWNSSTMMFIFSEAMKIHAQMFRNQEQWRQYATTMR